MQGPLYIGVAKVVGLRFECAGELVVQEGGMLCEECVLGRLIGQRDKPQSQRLWVHGRVNSSALTRSVPARPPIYQSVFPAIDIFYHKVAEYTTGRKAEFEAV